MAPTTLEQEDHARDAAFNKALHGQSAKARGGFSAMMGKDKKAQEAALDEYFKHWDQKPSADETDEIREVSIFSFQELRVRVLLTAWALGTKSRIRNLDQTVSSSVSL